MRLLFLDLLIIFYIAIMYKNLCVCVDMYIYIHTHIYGQNLSPVAGKSSTEKNNVPTKTIVIFQQDPSVFFVKNWDWKNMRFSCQIPFIFSRNNLLLSAEHFTARMAGTEEPAPVWK